jgi:AcrR family transcriptional regulator
MSVLRRNRVRKRNRSEPFRVRTYLPADARRAQILVAAKRVFADQGYHTANVDDLCRAAGIARGTIYQYFDNKRDVMVALMDDIAARIAHVLQTRPPIEPPRAGSTKSPVEMIVHFCRKRLRQVLDAIFLDEQTLRLILREARGLDGAIDDAIAKIDRMILREMESDVRAAQNARLLRRGSPRLIARYLLGGVEKMVMSSLLSDEPIDLGAIVETAVELELFGILSEEVRR